MALGRTQEARLRCICWLALLRTNASPESAEGDMLHVPALAIDI